MEWEPSPPSQAALDDAAQHSAFMQRVADDLAICEAAKPAPRAPPPRRVVTPNKHLGPLLEKIGRLVGQTIRERCERLEKRIAELESRPVFDYTGTFKQGRTYRKGQGCTHDGSIFVALKDYPTTPGTTNCGWQLACKRGRDGKVK